MRRQAPWREVMFKGLPTQLEKTVLKNLDEILARRIGELESGVVSKDEIDKFLEVASAPAMQGACLFLWKRIPMAKIQRFKEGRVIVSELKE